MYIVSVGEVGKICLPQPSLLELLLLPIKTAHEVRGLEFIQDFMVGGGGEVCGALPQRHETILVLSVRLYKFCFDCETIPISGGRGEFQGPHPLYKTLMCICTCICMSETLHFGTMCYMEWHVSQAELTK